MTNTTDNRLAGIFKLGRPFSPLYSCLMANRSSLYRKGFFAQHRLAAPVISVGNLVMGGTGKTPLVHYIAELLLRNNRKPAVLSRGYKGTSREPVNVVSNGKEIFMSAAEVGDEPRLLADTLPGVPVLTGKKRFLTGRHAIDDLGIDTVILDDGFQHLAVQRDLDLVLFSAYELLGNGRVIPGGVLREPLSSLNRADGFIITGVNEERDTKVAEFISFLQQKFPRKPVFKGRYQADEKIMRLDQDNTELLPLAELKNTPLLGFCGTAQPLSFKSTLLNEELQLTDFSSYPDHYLYSRPEIISLVEKAQSSGANGLITTAKDFVKLKEVFVPDFPLYVLSVKLQMRQEFDTYLLTHLAGSSF
jgi:tetraacyldisaccharide 4'-kinase